MAIEPRGELSERTRGAPHLWRCLLNLLAVAMAMSIAVRVAHAGSKAGPDDEPDEDEAIAVRLFDEGRALAEDEQWPEACAKFEGSLRRDPALGTNLNLARCYEKLGKLGRAWRLYRASVDLAGRTGNVVRRDFAQARVEALELRLAKLVISWSGKRPAGLVMTWDGHRLDRNQLRITLYVDAGAHRLIASAPGHDLFVKRVTLVAGQTRVIEIPELQASRPRDGDAGTDAGGRTGQPAVASGESALRRYVTVGLGAVGMSATSIGLMIGARAKDRYDDARALCPVAPCSQRAVALNRDARADAIAATALVIAGAAAMITGEVLHLTRPQAQAGSTATVSPIVQNGGGGIALSGRF